MKKAIRVNKVLVDWSQNDDHKTTVAVYSLRARERPTVSTPVTWEEVEAAFKKKDPKLLTFEAGQVLERVEKHGDLFAPVLKMKQKLPALAGIEEAQAEATRSAPEHSAPARKTARRSLPAKAAKKTSAKRRKV